MTVQGAVLRALRKPRGTARQGFGATSRRDNWIVYPVVQAVVFTVCATYLTFSGVFWGPIFGPQYVHADGYLSPLFSPLLIFKDMPTWLSPGTSFGFSGSSGTGARASSSPTPFRLPRWTGKPWPPWGASSTASRP